MSNERPTASDPRPDSPPDPEGASHVPVLLDDVLNGLQILPDARLIDATIGGGGHAAQMLQHSAPDGWLLGLDADPAAIRRVKQRLSHAVADKRLRLAHAHFRDIAQVAAAHDFHAVDGILCDLGVSSYQLATAARGFSFMHDGPLDMRLDTTQGNSAADIVNHWDEKELADILYIYGEERRSRRIAKAIVGKRPFRSTTQLADLVTQAVGGRRGQKIHPATKVFQALRIEVNQELAQLEQMLPKALGLLKPGGRMVIISFHSLEDRIVKRWMQAQARTFEPDPTHPHGGRECQPTIKAITRKPIQATVDEIALNPRSRSAKLRIAESIIL